MIDRDGASGPNLTETTREFAPNSDRSANFPSNQQESESNATGERAAVQAEEHRARLPNSGTSLRL